MNAAKVEEGTLATRLHFDVISPVIRDMKGLLDFIVLDCTHPDVTVEKYSWASLCTGDKNPHGMPNL